MFSLLGQYLTIGGSRFLLPSFCVGGSMFVMWLGERITDKGVGNGISFIILIGIIARFPSAVISEFALNLHGEGGLI